MTDQQPQKSFEELVNELQSEIPDIRAMALYEMAGLEDERVPELIVAAMNDKEKEVRIWGILGVVRRYYNGQARPKSEGQHYIEGLLKLLDQEKDEKIRETAISALGMPKDPVTVELLIGFLNDNLSYIREAAVQALGMIGLDPNWWRVKKRHLQDKWAVS